MAQTQYDSVSAPPRLPLVVVTSNRDGTVTKDARLVNCYIEVTKEGELDIYKRPGLASAGIIADGDAGQGVFFWRGNVYSIFAGTLYKDGVAIPGSVNPAGTYRFDSILGANPKMIFGNGFDTYTYNDLDGLSAALETIDSDFPTFVVKGFAYLNGFTYVMRPDAAIFQSELNNVDSPTSWNPINFVVANIEPDQGVFLSKQLVYVVALKQWTVEYFFDAGNPTGSSLGPVQGMKVSYGCAHQDSVQKINDVLFFLSNDQTASLQISTLNQGAHSVVSTPSIDRLLRTQSTTTVYSWQLKIDGHSFYVITFKDSNLTLAYDITQDLWFQWTDSNGNYFPIISSSYDSAGRHILQHETSGRLYYCSTDYKKDLNEPIVIDIITPKFDADSYRRKQLSMLKVIGDQVEGSTLQVRHSDNDYQSWSNWRTVDLGAKQPMLINCGTFVKRAYQLRHAADTPFRIRALEVQYDVGSL